MKNYILVLLVLPVLVNGQMFEAHLVISDASRNSDTITIGRDQDASSKIDANFVHTTASFILFESLNNLTLGKL